MRVLFEAKRQLLDLMTQTGFPEDCMISSRTDSNQPDPYLDLTTAILSTGLYPNVCYHKEKRKVLTTESKAALIHKTSVNCSNFQVKFPYPFFVFGEKIRTRALSCKQMTMVPPIHLLLFASRKVDATNDSKVRIDNWLLFDMNPYHASLITALRPAIENLVLFAAESPDEVINLEPAQKNLVDIVKDLCIFDAGDYNIKRETGPTPSEGRSMLTDFPSGQSFQSGGSRFPNDYKRPYGGGGGNFYPNKRGNLHSYGNRFGPSKF